MKKLLLVLLLLIPFQINAMVEPPMATVINLDTLHRKSVEIGAMDAFDDGYVLEVSNGYEFIASDKLGYSVASSYSTTLSSSMTSTQNTVSVSSITTKIGDELSMAVLGAKVFFTLEPGGSKEEIVMCTGLSGTSWTGCTRGLSSIGTSTVTVAARRNTHSAGSIIIMSNVHYVYDEMVDKDTDETISGDKTFTGDTHFNNLPTSTTTYATNNNEIITLGQANSIGNQGAATSTFDTSGIARKGTKEQIANGTDLGILNPLYIPVEFASSSRDVATTSLVVTEADGYINQNRIDLSEDFSFSGTTTFTGKLEGASNNWFGDGSDGDVVISSNTSLTSDMFYDNLTINTGIILKPNGYRLFVKDTLTFIGTGKIQNNGGDGGNGGNGSTPGTFGAGGAAGTIAYTTDNTTLPYPLAGVAGVVGKYVNDSDSAGNSGTPGTSRDKALNINASGDGGAGGAAGYSGVDPSNVGGSSGSSGNATYSNMSFNVLSDTFSFIDFSDDNISILYPTTGSGSGGSGAVVGVFSGDLAASGGSGGSGASGCFIQVNARNIITVNGNTYVESNGGDGGDGGDGDTAGGSSASSAGGGGGGAGGAGGILVLVYETKTGTGTISLLGGTGGEGGTGSLWCSGGGSACGTAYDGLSGGNGADGTSYLFDL